MVYKIRIDVFSMGNTRRNATFIITEARLINNSTVKPARKHLYR